jgi:hypothetical protein
LKTFILVSAAALALGACASSGAAPSTTGPEAASPGAEASTPRVRRNPSVITRAEIEATQLSNVGAVIQRLRPRWLAVRSFEGSSQDIYVYRDGVVAGTHHELGGMSTTDVERIEFVDPITALSRFGGSNGVNHVHGAILVTTSSGHVQSGNH